MTDKTWKKRKTKMDIIASRTGKRTFWYRALVLLLLSAFFCWLFWAVQSGHSPFLSASFCEDVRLYYGGTVCLSGSFRDPCLSLAQKPEVRREDLFWHCGAVSSGGANDFSFL